MNVLIISDSHGNIVNLKHVMGFGKKIGVRAVIHCGDWDNMAAVETVLAYKIPVYSVLGNADIDPKIRGMFNDQWLMVNLDGKKIGVIHKLIIGHQPLAIGCDIVFCGHEHRQYQEGNIINPGALENDVNFAIYDTKTDRVELIHE